MPIAIAEAKPVSRQPMHITTRNPLLPKSPEHFKYLNPSFLLATFPNNHNLFEEMIKTFKRVTVIKLAESRTAIATRNYTEMGRLAHSMKPMGDYLGVPLMRSLVERFEAAVITRNFGRIKKQFCLLERLVTIINQEIDTYLSR